MLHQKRMPKIGAKKIFFLCNKTNTELEYVVIGWVFSCPVVFPDQRDYLDKAQQSIGGFLVEYSSVHIL